MKRCYMSVGATIDYGMLGSQPKRTFQTNYTIDPKTDVTLAADEQAACELCGSRTQCSNRYGMLACQPCQRDLLPASGFF